MNDLTLRVPRGGVLGFLGPVIPPAIPRRSAAWARWSLRGRPARRVRERRAGWTGASGGFPGAALPDQTHAIIVLAVYTLVLGGTAFWLFERRDVQGATGGA